MKRTDSPRDYSRRVPASPRPRIHLLAGLAPAVFFVFFVVNLPGCDDMFQQPRYDPLEPATLFADGTSARPIVANTVAIGHAETNEHLYKGTINGKLAETFPFPITAADLSRGQQRFDIYCTPCHGLLGNGKGMIVQRGFTQPPSYHIDRLRNAPVGHFFEVTTRGWGAMFPYNDRVKPEDRWRIAAYIRALQLSQNVPAASLPAEERQKLEKLEAGGQTP